MFLQNKQTDSLVEIRDLEALISATKNTVLGQSQQGEEEQDPEQFKKENLVFPSGENLPRCWIDENYRK
ncbi:acetyltransferase [Scytonema hofmannii PCC 7110]|uniref:Acetyltransferase n=1 Tax=Scytonema hofmannii PCC 7110 TaxID=128403 RepID=A0A139WWJ9_9CYAN|nr:hypothetical protein [Scytonema hofmannii]KYC36814.1 acetyltransferase [Scytonema hofmannii PCC 7110]